MGFKICVIGCGGIANQVHGFSYKKYADLHADTILAACCDIDESKAEKFKDDYGFERYYRDYQLMLEKEKPDAVCLNSPVHLTAEMSIKIIGQGYPLLLEKPPGRTKEETLSIIRAAKKNGIKQQVAFNRRYLPVIDALYRDIYTCYRHQDIQNISCDFFRVDRRDDDFSTTAIHGIDAVRYLAGVDYEKIDFSYQEMPEFGDRVCNIYMQCRFVSGTFAQLRFCPMAGIVAERLTVHARDSTFMAFLPVYENSADFPGRLLRYTGGKKIYEFSGETLAGGLGLFETNGFYQEDTAFFEAVRNEKMPQADLDSAVQSVEVADYIRRRMPSYKLKGNA